MTDCIVCQKLAEGKANIVYQDDICVAVLPSRPAVFGHLKIYPRKHANRMDELTKPIFESMMYLANVASSAVFDVTKSQGSNIIILEHDLHLCIDVIPRKESDNLKLSWQPKPANPQDLDQAFASIKDNTFVVGKRNEPERSKPAAEPTPQKISEPEKENYLIKHLQKSP